jgi:hypothetical protein
MHDRGSHPGCAALRQLEQRRACGMLPDDHMVFCRPSYKMSPLILDRPPAALRSCTPPHHSVALVDRCDRAATPEKLMLLGDSRMLMYNLYATFTYRHQLWILLSQLCCCAALLIKCMVGASILYTTGIAAYPGSNTEAARRRFQAAGATGCGLRTCTSVCMLVAEQGFQPPWPDNRLLQKEDLLQSLRDIAASPPLSACLHLVEQLVQDGVCSWDVLQVQPRPQRPTAKNAFQQPPSLSLCMLQDMYSDPEQLKQVLHVTGVQQHLQQQLQLQHDVLVPPPTKSPPGAQCSPFAAVMLQLLLDEPSNTQSHGEAGVAVATHIHQCSISEAHQRQVARTTSLAGCGSRRRYLASSI